MSTSLLKTLQVSSSQDFYFYSTSTLTSSTNIELSYLNYLDFSLSNSILLKKSSSNNSNSPFWITIKPNKNEFITLKNLKVESNSKFAEIYLSKLSYNNDIIEKSLTSGGGEGFEYIETIRGYSSSNNKLKSFIIETNPTIESKLYNKKCRQIRIKFLSVQNIPKEVEEVNIQCLNINLNASNQTDAYEAEVEPFTDKDADSMRTMMMSMMSKSSGGGMDLGTAMALINKKELDTKAPPILPFILPEQSQPLPLPINHIMDKKMQEIMLAISAKQQSMLNQMQAMIEDKLKPIVARVARVEEMQTQMLQKKNISNESNIYETNPKLNKKDDDAMSILIQRIESIEKKQNLYVNKEYDQNDLLNKISLEKNKDFINPHPKEEDKFNYIKKSLFEEKQKFDLRLKAEDEMRQQVQELEKNIGDEKKNRIYSTFINERLNVLTDLENDRKNKQAKLQERLEIAKQKRLIQYSSGSVDPNPSKSSLNKETKTKDDVNISSSDIDSEDDERDGRYGDGCDVVDLSTAMNKLTNALSSRQGEDEDSDDDVDIDDYIFNGNAPVSNKNSNNKNNIMSFKFNNKHLVDVIDANDSKRKLNKINENSQINTKFFSNNESNETSPSIQKLSEPTNEVENMLKKDFSFSGVIYGGIDKNAALKKDMRSLMSLLRKNPGSLEEKI